MLIYVNELYLKKGTLHKNEGIVKELQGLVKSLNCLQVERLKTGRKVHEKSKQYSKGSCWKQEDIPPKPEIASK